MQKVLVIMKPDALERGLAGTILSRFEAANMSPIAARMVQATDDLLDSHYPAGLAAAIGQKSCAAGLVEQHEAVGYGLQVLGWNREYLKRRPLLIFVMAGPEAAALARTVIGTTDPPHAPVGTIRRDFGTDSVRAANLESRSVENLVHASESETDAAREIAVWFPDLEGRLQQSTGRE